MSETADRDEVLRVLGDPVRWRIVTLFGDEDELACGVLQRALPVSKPTVSYHTSVMARAGLIDVHRRGRHVTYTLRRELLGDLLRDLAGLLPGEPVRAPVVRALPTW
ncbi:helix-turn-helix transcriptional regulator [Blastococcus sp. TF02A-26]|uniref:ArsR/SmtB family transcription factor n=1 Tax=Blastococcus sp. TF02A-26 TaxID=2250577 RepID=UPI000E1AA7E5|nr:metalloregulator ArsR/SmtB family transcription factor [Blastococcus sp. TF02A-26]RBY84337.1 transcriptional regulator [Blastococcus sp. TF02A-26]